VPNHNVSACIPSNGRGWDDRYPWFQGGPVANRLFEITRRRSRSIESALGAGDGRPWLNRVRRQSARSGYAVRQCTDNCLLRLLGAAVGGLLVDAKRQGLSTTRQPPRPRGVEVNGISVYAFLQINARASIYPLLFTSLYSARAMRGDQRSCELAQSSA